MDWLENWRGHASMDNATSSSHGGVHRMLDQDNDDVRTATENAGRRSSPQSVQTGNVGRDEPRSTPRVRTRVRKPSAVDTDFPVELTAPSGGNDQPTDDQTKNDLWSPAEDARLLAAIFGGSGINPTINSSEPIDMSPSEWLEVKRIYDGLARPKSEPTVPLRSTHALRSRFEEVLLPQQQPIARVSAPTEPGPSRSGSDLPVSPTPSSTAAGTLSATPGAIDLSDTEPAQTTTTTGQELGCGQSSTTLPVQPLQIQGTRRDLPPSESSAPEISIPASPVSVASFDTAAAAAFFPGSNDPLPASSRLKSASDASSACGRAVAQMISPSQDPATAHAANLDESMVRSVGKLIDPPNHKKRFSQEDDARLVELRRSGTTWRAIATRIGRTKKSCEARYSLIREKAKSAGPEPPDFTAPTTTVSPSTAAHTSPGSPPTASSSAQALTAAAARPSYTARDDVTILRMYLQGASAEGIGTAIDRSTVSVHRRWTEKRDEWIAAGLLAVGSRLKLRDYEQLPSLPSGPATTTPLPDPLTNLRARSLDMAGARQDAHGPSSWDGTVEPLPEAETAQTDLGGFDSFYFNEDLLTGPTLPDIGAESAVIAEAGAPPPPAPQIQNPPKVSAAATLRSRQESPLVPSASAHDSSASEMAAEKMISDAMPHCNSGMQGLNRFLRLVKSGKKC